MEKIVLILGIMGTLAAFAYAISIWDMDENDFNL